MKLFLFGAPRLEQDGQAVPFNLRKGQALLAYLAETGQAHSRDFLATLFWPESDQAAARGRLRRTLYRIGQALGHELLLTAGDTVGLHPEAALWVDTVAAREPHAPPGRAWQPELAELEAGVALATAGFMAGFSLGDCPEFDEWQYFQQAEWRQILAGALVRLVDAYRKRSEWEQAIVAARRWLGLDPLHEPAHRRLMGLYALAGQQAAALRQYEQAVALAERLARESLAIHREIGLRDRVADSLTTLNWITLAADKREESKALRQEAMAIWHALGVEDRVTLPAGLEDQPFTPRWFAEVIDRRIAAVEGAARKAQTSAARMDSSLRPE